MKISKREKIMLVFMGIAVAGFLYYNFVFKHENNTIKKLQADYDSKKVLVLRGRESETRLQDIKGLLIELQNQIDIKKKKMSGPLRTPEVITELNTMAAQKSVKIDNIVFTGDAAVKGEYKASGNTGGIDNIQQISPAAITDNNGQASTQAKSELKKITVTFALEGSYGNCLNLVKAFENNKRLYVIKNLQMSGNNGICNGTITVEMVSVAEHSEDFLYNAGGGTGRTDMFK